MLRNAIALRQRLLTFYFSLASVCPESIVASDHAEYGLRMMKRLLVISLFSLLFGGCWMPSYAAQTASQYTVNISEQDKRLVRIEARIIPKGNILAVCPEGANHLPDKWATFIRNLAAKDDSGAVIPLQYLGQGAWQIPEPLPKSITLTYDVLIKHDQGKWPFGAKEAAYVRDDCVFYTGASLFITMLELKNMTVRFNVPNGWKVTVPWQEVSGQENTFRVSDAEELVWIGMLVGKHLERKTHVGKLEVTLAIGQDLKPSAGLFDQTVKSIVPAYIKIYGGEPVFRGSSINKFVIFANRDPNYEGGGAVFVRTISMMLKDLPKKQDGSSTFSWSHIIVHEMGHLWNGQSIREAGQEFWFNEGVTDYLAYLLEARAGLISRQELLKAFAQKYDEYLAVAGKLSMRRAGDDKGNNYDLVYSGGLIASLALDVELRRDTKNVDGLESLLKRMYGEFGIQDKKYALEDILNLANRIAKTNLQPFFKDYIEGTKIIPLEKYLDSLGLDIKRGGVSDKSHTTIQNKSKASRSQRVLFQKVTGLSYTAI